MVRGTAFILTENKGDLRQKERVAVVVTLCHLSCVSSDLCHLQGPIIVSA